MHGYRSACKQNWVLTNCGCLGEVECCGVWHTISQSSSEGKPFPCQERKPQRDLFFFSPWLETLIKLNVWTGGTQFSERKKFFGVGLINSAGISNWRIAALVLGGFRARVTPWAYSNHGRVFFVSWKTWLQQGLAVCLTGDGAAVGEPLLGRV